jgi:hypothetical protein
VSPTFTTHLSSLLAMSADLVPPSPRAEAIRGTLFVLAFAAVLTLGTAVFFSRSATKAVATGGVVAGANFYAMARMVASVLGRETGHAASAWRATSPLKLLGFLGIVGIILVRHLVDAVPFLCGYGALPLGLFTWAFVTRPADGEDGG